MGFHNLASQAVAEAAVDLLPGRPTVVELGNQTLKNSKARGLIYQRLGITPPTHELTSTREWYLSLGFSRYLAIDVNTERDAVAMDLNLDIRSHYGFTEQSDLVTNNGTGEHVFNQYAVFKNAHDLCRVGGYMVHVLPFYRWVDHGFYNYNPNLFACLAHANHYDLKGLWIATNDTAILHKLDPGNLSRQKGYRVTLDLDSWEKDPTVVAIMKRVNADEFRVPIQYMYGGENISSAEIAGRYQ